MITEQDLLGMGFKRSTDPTFFTLGSITASPCKDGYNFIDTVQCRIIGMTPTPTPTVVYDAIRSYYNAQVDSASFVLAVLDSPDRPRMVIVPDSDEDIILKYILQHNKQFDEELSVTEIAQHEKMKGKGNPVAYGTYTYVSDICQKLRDAGLIHVTEDNEEARYWHDDFVPRDVAIYNKTLHDNTADEDDED